MFSLLVESSQQSAWQVNGGFGDYWPILLTLEKLIVQRIVSLVQQMWTAPYDWTDGVRRVWRGNPLFS